jgi:serine/threonine-protein kinase
MGVVYQAHDRALDEIVAVKILRPEFSADPAMAERFKSEIKLARKVRHRNVCSIHDFGEDRGLLYFSMEFVDGVDLKRYIKKMGALPTDEAYALTIQIVEGLQAVHEVGIIHRDMKTANVMRDSHGLARLMDFGVAKLPGDGHTLTATGAIVGTPEYMSPEQAQGKKVDQRTDLYALGIIVYEIFTGHVPFKGETPISTILKHINEPPPFDGRAAERMPEGLRSVLRRALAKEPADRYGSAAEMAEAIRRSRSPSLRQELVPTGALEAPTVLSRREAGSPWPLKWMLPVAALLLAAVGALVVLQFRAGSQRDSPSSAPPLPEAPLPAAAPAAPTAESPAPSRPSLPEVTPPATKMVPTRTPLPPPSTSSATPLGASAVPPSPVPAPAPSTAPAAMATDAPRAEPSSSPGFLRVAVVPWAEVTVDGRVVGTTPIDAFSLTPGRHRLRLRHPSYEVLEREVVVRPGETTRVVVNFPKEGVPKSR